MKAGRNDPCPCGSGKKYKKCCMEKDLAAEREERAVISTPPKLKQKTWADFEHLKVNDFIDDDDFDEDEDEEEEPERFVDPRQISLFGDEESPPVPQQQLKSTDDEIDFEASEKRWDEFESARYEKKIAIFLKTLEEKELMDRDMAFEMLSRIYNGAIKAGQRDCFAELVDRLKEQLPEVYEQDASFYLKWRITDAVVGYQSDDVISFLNEMAPKASKNIDTFNNVVDILAYHGYQALLAEAFKTAWQYVENSPDIVPWGIDEFSDRAINYTVFEYVDAHPKVNANDPVLIKNARYFLEEINFKRFAKFVDYVAGNIKRQWILDDFDPKAKQQKATKEQRGKKSKKHSEQNLYYLTLEFLSYLRKQENVPFSKGLLASDQIYSYFLERGKGELVERPSPLEQALSGGRLKPKKQPRPRHILCPDSNTLNVFGGRLLDFVNRQHYKLAATIELIPAWLRFLEIHNLIDNPIHQETLKDIRKNLIKQVLNIYDHDTSDPFLRRNLERIWQI